MYIYFSSAVFFQTKVRLWFELHFLGNGFFKSLRIGATGRNLFTFTKYSGYDPEVASGEATNQFYDSFSYPNFRTFTGSIEIKF